MATQFSGGTCANNTFAVANKYDLMHNIRSNCVTAGMTSVSTGIGLGPGNSGTVTITIASPGVVTFAGHGFLGGEQIIFNTTGALPTGITAGTTYFVKFIDANSFNIAATFGGANINTTGTQSGTQELYSKTILLQTATQTNVANPIRIRLQDNGLTGIQVSIEAQSGTPAGANGNTNGATLQTGLTYRIIAWQYHFMVFVSGTVTPQQRCFCMAGMPFVPGFLTGISNAGYLLSNTHNAGDATVRVTPTRDGPYVYHSGTTITIGSSFTVSNWQTIWNSNIIDNGQNNNEGDGTPVLIVPAPNNMAIQTAFGYRWANDDLNTADPVLCHGQSAYTDEGKLHGQWFDMIFITQPFTIDSTDSFNSHNWFNLSNNHSEGGIWIATS